MPSSIRKRSELTFICENYRRTVNQLLPYQVQHGGDLFLPADNESDDCVEEIVDLFDVLFRFLALPQKKVHIDVQLASQVLGNMEGV